METLAALVLLAHFTGTPTVGGPSKAWWQSLTSSDNVPCCDIADGQKVLDADWRTATVAGKVRFEVRLAGKWILVPKSAVVTVPNRFGPSVVWPYTDSEGQTQIRCFLPGAGA